MSRTNSKNLTCTINHLALCGHEIWKKAHRHILKFLRLAAVIPAPPLLTFGNLKTLKDLLVRSKGIVRFSMKNGVDDWSRSHYQVYLDFTENNKFGRCLTKRQYKINFPLFCSDRNDLHLSTCKYMPNPVSWIKSQQIL